MPCTQCKESFQDSYNVTVDTLKCESPSLSAHDMRIQAAKRFRPIFHAMKEASRIENEGKEVYVNGEFEFTPDGEMYFTNAGVTSEQLHSNQLRSSELKNKPSEYSVGDHQRSRLIQYAFNNGATVVRTTFSRDGQDNRDIVEYVYDRAMNRGFIRVINTSQNGLYHNFDNIREIARRQSPHLVEVAPSEKVFILTDATILPDKAQSVIKAIRYPDRHVSDSPIPSISSKEPTVSLHKQTVRSVSIEEPFRPKARGSIQQVTETMAHVSHRIARDTGETIIGVSRFLQRKGIRQNTRDRVLGLPVVPDVRIVFEKNTSGLSKPDGQSARLTLKRIRSRAVRIDESIVKRHREMRRDVVALGIIAEKGVAVHAIPMFLASLAEKLPAPVRAMEKSIKRHKKKEIRLKNHEVRKRKQDTRSDVKEGQSFKIEHKGRKKRRKTHKEVLTSDNKHIPKERKALRKRKRKIGVGEKTGKKSAVVDRLTVFTFKKEKQLNKNRMRRKAGKVEQVMEFKRLSKREKKLWRLVTGFARRMEHQRKEMNRTPYRITKSESVKRTKTREVARRETVFRKTRKESKEAINNFFFALFFWVLLKHFEKQMQTHVTEKPQETRKEENLPVSQEIGQNQRQENLIVKEPAPWILLSVIWYLVMAREGGLVKMPNANPPAGGPMPNKKSGKKKRFKKKQFFQTSSIPKHAVIFAFNS